MSVARGPPSRKRASYSANGSPKTDVTPLVRKLANQQVIRAAENLLKMVDVAAIVSSSEASAKDGGSLVTSEIDSSAEQQVAGKSTGSSELSSQNRLERRRSNLKLQVTSAGVDQSRLSPPVSPRKNVRWRENNETKFFQRTPESVDEEGGFKKKANERPVEVKGAVASNWAEGLEKGLGAIGGALYQEVALLVGHMPLDEQALGQSLQQVADRVAGACEAAISGNVPEHVAERLTTDVDELSGRFVGLAAAINYSPDAAERGGLVIAASAIAALTSEVAVQLGTLFAEMPLGGKELGFRLQSAHDALTEVIEDSGPSEDYTLLHASFETEAERLSALFTFLVLAVNSDREMTPAAKLVAQAVEDLRSTMEAILTPSVFPLEPVKLDGKMRRMVEHAVEELRQDARKMGVIASDVNALLMELRRKTEGLVAEYRAKNIASKQLAPIDSS